MASMMQYIDDMEQRNKVIAGATPCHTDSHNNMEGGVVGTDWRHGIYLARPALRSVAGGISAGSHPGAAGAAAVSSAITGNNVLRGCSWAASWAALAAAVGDYASSSMAWMGGSAVKAKSRDRACR